MYFKAWDYRGEKDFFGQGHMGSLEQTRISLVVGSPPVPPSWPRGLVVIRSEGPVHGRLSMGAVTWSRDAGSS